MAQSSPETNMAILANVNELTAQTVASMMGNQAVRNLFGRSAGRTNIYQAAMLAVRKQLEGQIRNLPTGQFNKSVLTGAHQAGGEYPNVSA